MNNTALKVVAWLNLLVILPHGICSSDAPNTGSEKQVVFGNKLFSLFMPEATIQKRVAELGAQISHDYQGKVPVIICVLKGAVLFYTDLIRHIDVPCELDFLTLSSYGNAMTSSGKVEMQGGLKTVLTDRDVIVVEDIADSGRSLKFLRELLLKQNPRSLSFAVLLKRDTAKLDFLINYVGFDITGTFIIGYGLDYAQQARNLKEIYSFVKQLD